MRHRNLVGPLFALAVAAPMPAAAQALSGKIAELIRFGTCPEALCLVTGGGGVHATHYLISAQTANTDLLNFLTNAITSSVGRLPVSATSSGTSFSFVNGAPVQNTSSMGPIFAERAATLGHKKAMVGVSTSRIAFSDLRGQSIKDLNINLGHQDVLLPGLGDSPNEADVVAIDLNMKVDLQVTSLFATYGLTDRMDVSFSVPLVMSSLDATGVGHVFNPTGPVTGNHRFGTLTSPVDTAHSAVSGSSTGIGDITARVKFNIQHNTKSGIAVLADFHLPTGDEKEFLGSGAFSTNALLIASTTYGKFAPHANLGFAVRTGDAQNNALLGTIGFDQMLNKKATVAVDILSEFQAGGDAGTLPPDINLSLVSPPRLIKGTNIANEKDNPINLSAGGRFLVGGFTVVANGLVPIKSGGLQAKFVWTIGVERGF